MAGTRDGASVRIGLLWHSASSGNFGVGALTVANMVIIREVAKRLGREPQFVIIGMRDGDVQYISADEAEIFAVDTRSLLSPSGYWKVLADLDCVIDIGAGDSFAEIYGPKRFAFLWLTKVLASLRGKPLMLAPQTIGPFTHWPYTWLAKFAMEHATSVIARDNDSLTALKALAPRAHGALAVDVAFALTYQDRSAERGGTPLRVGVNVSGLLFDQAETGANRFGLSVNYARLMRRFLTELVSRPGVEVHLISHVLSIEEQADDDGRLADILHREFPQAIRVKDFTGPSDAKSYISSLDFLVAARMHACIAALSSGVPVVPVAYSRKFSGLFGMLDYNWLVPVSGFTEDQALDYLFDALEKRDQMAADAGRSMEKVASLLQVYRSELEKLLSEGAATA